MNYLSKKQLITLGVLIVILGGLLVLGEKFSATENFVPEKFQKREEVPAVSTIVPSATLAGISESSGHFDQMPQVVTKSTASKLSYSEAVDLYKNSILQFGEDCQLSTKSRSFRLGNEVLIDNRSPQPKTITVGTIPIVVDPYDYGFIILSEKGNLVPVSCGDRANIAQLSVQ